MDDRQRRNIIRHRRNRSLVSKTVMKTKLDVDGAMEYLINPTKSGLWKMTFQWKNGKGINKLINEATERQIKKLEAKHGEEYTKDRKRRIRYAIDESENIGFILRLFYRTKKYQEGKDPDEIYFRGSSAEDIYNRYLFINYSNLSKKYPEALNFYKKNIYNENFGGFAGPSFSGIKSGNFIANFDEDDKSTNPSVTLISTHPEPIKDLYKLLSLAGKTGEEELYTVFSPEEELLQPYIEILRPMLNSTGISSEMQQHFDNMIADYDGRNYTSCVASAGLVAEECLIQVYESIARKPCPPRQTLGDLRKKIGEYVKGITSPSKQNKLPKNRKDLMKTIDKLSEGNLDSINNSNIIKLLEYVDNKDQKTLSEIHKHKDSSQNLQIFPETVLLSLDSLVSYRNYSLHKSTVIIGQLEALKSVYGSFCLLTWWNSQKTKIKASQTKKDVINLLLEAAKKY